MPEIKDITVGGSYTYYPEAYRPIKGEAAITFQLVGGEDEAEATSIMRERVTEMILEQIAIISGVHAEIEKGVTPQELVNGEDEDDDSIILEDDDLDFGF
jgi:hypothetical protein